MMPEACDELSDYEGLTQIPIWGTTFRFSKRGAQFLEERAGFLARPDTTVSVGIIIAGS
jgi:hypothetical protein